MTSTPITDEREAVERTREGAGLLARIPGFGTPTAGFTFAWTIALLVANIGIVVTGGAVRLTGSGLGCPTWPQCSDGTFVPHAALGVHGVIEFTNRMLTWVLVVVAIATVVAVWRRGTLAPHAGRRADRWLVVLIALGVPFQGVIGGITVLTDLNPWIVSLHFLLSVVLVAAATVLVFRTRDRRLPVEPGRSAATLGRALAALIFLLTWVTIYLGTVVTGSGPHAGDVHAPRNGLVPAHMTQMHADAVFVLVGLAVAAAVSFTVLRMPQARTSWVFVVLLAAQGVIGGVQYATHLPIAMVIAHMLGGALLVVGATWLVMSFGGVRSAASRTADTTVR